LFAKSKATKLKLKIKNKLTTSFFARLAKKLANKTLLSIVVFFDFNVDFTINNNKFFNSNTNSKTSINTTIVTKISLNKKDKFIINKIAYWQFGESIFQFQDAKITQVARDQSQERSRSNGKLAFRKSKKLNKKYNFDIRDAHELSQYFD